IRQNAIWLSRCCVARIWRAWQIVVVSAARRSCRRRGGTYTEYHADLVDSLFSKPHVIIRSDSDARRCTGSRRNRVFRNGTAGGNHADPVAVSLRKPDIIIRSADDTGGSTSSGWDRKLRDSTGWS